MRPVFLPSCFVLAGTLWTVAASAATYEVGSIPDLQARIDAAVAGDVIDVQNAVYTTSAYITVNRQGTATEPIRIVAKTAGGVEITGTHGFDVRSPASHVEVEG